MYSYHQCKLQKSNESVFALKIQQGVPSGKKLQNFCDHFVSILIMQLCFKFIFSKHNTEYHWAIRQQYQPCRIDHKFQITYLFGKCIHIISIYFKIWMKGVCRRNSTGGNLKGKYYKMFATTLFQYFTKTCKRGPS